MKKVYVKYIYNDGRECLGTMLPRLVNIDNRMTKLNFINKTMANCKQSLFDNLKFYKGVNQIEIYSYSNLYDNSTFKLLSSETFSFYSIERYL